MGTVGVVSIYSTLFSLHDRSLSLSTSASLFFISNSFSLCLSSCELSPSLSSFSKLFLPYWTLSLLLSSESFPNSPLCFDGVPRRELPSLFFFTHRLPVYLPVLLLLRSSPFYFFHSTNFHTSSLHLPFI